jgi:alkylated DNA repair protein (DNA oxidative demethylase)
MALAMLAACSHEARRPRFQGIVGPIDKEWQSLPLHYLPGRLDRSAQMELIAALRAVIAEAPLFTPTMPGSGCPMSVRMTNCGPLGWVTDKERGYRYQATHPETRKAWPAIPPMLLALWADVADYPARPEACLVNYYAGAAKMGLHQDKDEEDFAAPVLSVSLGDAAIFRVGGLARKAPTRKFELKSGDVVVLGGEARLAFHGIDRVLPGTSDLLEEGGRFNLTLRRVTKPGMSEV